MRQFCKHEINEIVAMAMVKQERQSCSAVLSKQKNPSQDNPVSPPLIWGITKGVLTAAHPVLPTQEYDGDRSDFASGKSKANCEPDEAICIDTDEPAEVCHPVAEVGHDVACCK